MGRGSGKRAARKRAADLAVGSREDDAKLERVTARRLAKLEKDLAAAHRAAERHQSRLETASAEVDRIRGEIASLLRHASEPAVGGAKKVGHAAADLIEDAADVMADAAGGVVHAAGSVVGAARRSVRAKPRAEKKPREEKEAVPATPVPPVVTPKEPAKPLAKPRRRTARTASVPAKPAAARPRRARRVTPPATGPDNA
jgi:ElaB/YqjD/DUF883 family membrane-anchored ribosome-binding protein